MIVVYHGILPYDRSRHRGMMAAYGKRVPLVYVDPDTERQVPSDRSATTVLTRLGADPAPGCYPIALESILPGGRFRPIARANRWLAIRKLIASLREQTGRQVVLINQQPGLLPTLRRIGADATVYEIRDDYVSLALDDKSAARTQSAHDRLLSEADQVWAISRALVDAAASQRPDTLLTGVGVEYQDFATADESLAPEALRSLSRPRVGLVGNLNDRVDWRLLEDIARARPQWQVVVVGPVYHSSDAARIGLENLVALENAHHIGAVAQDALAPTIAALDVCLIPYRLTQATLRINSLKVYQYLAVGRPVVASRIPSINELADVVACVAPEGFIGAIEAALDDRAHDDQRRSRAAMFDWPAIVADQLRFLEKQLDPVYGDRR